MGTNGPLGHPTHDSSCHSRQCFRTETAALRPSRHQLTSVSQQPSKELQRMLAGVSVSSRTATVRDQCPPQTPLLPHQQTPAGSRWSLETRTTKESTTSLLPCMGFWFPPLWLFPGLLFPHCCPHTYIYKWFTY